MTEQEYEYTDPAVLTPGAAPLEAAARELGGETGLTVDPGLWRAPGAATRRGP
jgi:8-oxo-dGTP pyrophosphatase MutT (NUDIX family)